MKTKKVMRTILWGALTTGATLAIGFLSFSGMFVLSTSLWWCGGAFLLAAAYEGQVNGEGISIALRRMFDKNYLKLGIARRFLDEQLELYKQKKILRNKIKALQEILKNSEAIEKQQLLQLTKLKQQLAAIDCDEENTFLEDYEKQKKYGEELEEIHEPTKKQLQERIKAKKRLQEMELHFLTQLENPDKNNSTEITKSITKLVEKHRDTLLTEINRKAWLIRASWLFAIGGGVCSFLTTLSTMQVGLSVLGISSVIPGGILVTLSVFAAVGYTLLLYQAFSDMVQEYSGKWKTYFSKREDESTAGHILRCAGVVVAIGLAIFATIATAGTWWYAAKHGAAILGIVDKVASALRTVSISLMTLPSLAFGISNSLETVDNISKSDYKQLANNVINDVKETWHAEVKNVAGFFRFINPFRILENLISYTAKTTLFMGHLISMGLMSDHLDGVSPTTSTVLGMAAEAGEDLPYIKGKKGNEHSHQSPFLTLLFLPITLAVGILKGLAILWDRPFSGSWKTSYEKMFSHQHDHQHTNPIKPELSTHWQKQEVINACDKTMARLHGKSIDKVNAAQNIKTLVNQNANTSQLKEAAKPLAVNRNNFWQQKKTQSQKEMDFALNGYASAPRPIAGQAG